MYLVKYTYSWPDKDAVGGRYSKTIIRPIMTESLQYAQKILIEKCEKLGHQIEGIPEFVEGW